MAKKQAKSVAPETPVEMILVQRAEIDKQESALNILFEKQSAKLSKSFDSIKTKATKAKDKLAADKAKLKEAKAKLKEKATAANEKRVSKCQETLIVSQEKMDSLKEEMESLKAMHVEMKSLVKKHNAREKALAKFEKEWAKSLVKPKKAAKKKSQTKKSTSPEAMPKEIMLAEVAPVNESSPVSEQPLN